MKKLVLSLLSVVFILGQISSIKAFAFMIPFEYKNGQAVCQEHAKQTSKEIAKWVPVPIDYKNPQGPTTLLYSYTLTQFNPNNESLLYFVGGPGGSSRGIEFSLSNMNVIFFEERGISCSRPATKDLFIDPHFYSTENSARDGLMVLNSYKVRKAAIYGHSYGTVPATIFASKFPQRTQALILEGVIYKADESLWIAPRKVQNMQKYFDSLSLEKQQRIISFSERPDSSKTWFSFMAEMVMSVGNFPSGLNEFLDRTLLSPAENQEAADVADAALAAMMTSMVPKINTTTAAEEFYDGDVTMGMLACQELSMANPMLSHLLYFSNGRLVPDRNNIERGSMCVPLGLENVKNVPYSAEKYPITVPVTYFLGEYDPATSLDQGLNHFKSAFSNQKQAFILKGGGHTPNFEQLLEADYCGPEKASCDSFKQQLDQRKLFEQAAHGRMISDRNIRNYNALGERKWQAVLN